MSKLFFCNNLFKSLVVGLLIICFIPNLNAQSAEHGYAINPVPFTSVKVTDHFWAPRIKTNHEVTIPIAIQKCRETGRIMNFQRAARLETGPFCSKYPFDDSDVYKIIEGASYSLQTFPDPKLSLTLDTLIYYISLAQEPDGYLYTNRTIDSLHMHEWVGKKRWEKDPELSHELYNVGHMYEAAVAHFQATGKRTLLDVAIKNANLVYKDFVIGGLKYYPGHQVIEMGLVKLYRITGDKNYLELAKYFLDIRKGGEEYNQAHKPVVEQDKIVGHAVRATYMYSGMADVATLTGDKAYTAAIGKIWNDLLQTKYYITGGIGSGGDNEGFGEPYYLPNMSAYCETCASIGNVLWNYRMFLLTGESKYYDVLERTLYNALLSGVSLSGDRFFYPNPLESHGQHERSAWFGCACCPSNICRFLPSIPGFVYATGDNQVFVNLYMQNEGLVELSGNKIRISQKTDYPWSGKVEISISPEAAANFGVALRIPGWARGEAGPTDLYTFEKSAKPDFVLTLNGQNVPYEVKNGYALIQRVWKPGDRIQLELPMMIQKIHANANIKSDIDRVALQRGPIVYCLEWPDNPDGHVTSLVLDEKAEMQATFIPDLLNGVEVITAKGTSVRQTLKGIEAGENQGITAIPYCAWANRGAGEMLVWIPEKSTAARPVPLPGISSTSRVSGSAKGKSLGAVNDFDLPANSNDHDVLYFHWWPEKNCTEWIQYDFEKTSTVSEASVYWFDDGPSGGCRIPKSWRIMYKSGNEWIPVEPLSPYTVSKDQLNTVTFKPVTTEAMRLEIELETEFSTGIYEWSLK